jgi:hypothetical protein
LRIAYSDTHPAGWEQMARLESDGTLINHCNHLVVKAFWNITRHLFGVDLLF